MTRPLRDGAVGLTIEWSESPESFYRGNSSAMDFLGASAFDVPGERLGDQVRERFARADRAQILYLHGRLAGFCLYSRFEIDRGSALWLIEGRAIAAAHQRRGLGRGAFRDFLDTTGAAGVASVTRNPATCRITSAEFSAVLPDLTHSDPLGGLRSAEMSAAIEAYAEHLCVPRDELPFVRNRYPGGLYGREDPGSEMPMPEVRDDPACGVILVGLHRRLPAESPRAPVTPISDRQSR